MSLHLLVGILLWLAMSYRQFVVLFISFFDFFILLLEHFFLFFNFLV